MIEKILKIKFKHQRIKILEANVHQGNYVTKNFSIIQIGLKKTIKRKVIDNLSLRDNNKITKNTIKLDLNKNCTFVL